MVDVLKIKTGSPYEERESYSRLVAVGDWLIVSNTAGVNYATQVFPDTAVGQAQQALSNIKGALEAAGSSLADVVRSRGAIPNPEDAPDVMAEVGRAFRGVDPASTVTCTPSVARSTRSRSRSLHIEAQVQHRRTTRRCSCRRDEGASG